MSQTPNEAENDSDSKKRKTAKAKKKKEKPVTLEKPSPSEPEPAEPGENIPEISINDKQREELYRVTLDMILDANKIYQNKSRQMHKQVFQLEEVIRYYTILKDQLQSGVAPEQSDPSPAPEEKEKESSKVKKKKKPKKPEQPNEPEENCDDELLNAATIAPVDFSKIETLEAAKEAYSKLLLDYLEHQSVLDTIIGEKQVKVKLLTDELKQLGWSEEKEKDREDKSDNLPVSPRGDKKKSSSDLVPKSKKDDKSAKKKRNVLKFIKPRAQGPEKTVVQFPEGPTVSKVISTNKDILPLVKRHHTGTVTSNDFEQLSVIGQGAFGKVFLVMQKQTGQLMAMKVMEKASILEDGDESLRHVIHELEFMRDMSHHPFIVSLYHAFQTDTEVSLVMEWVGGGTLFDHLVKRDDPFSEDEARFFAAQVLLALQSLHANDIVYRDLKLENILLDGDGYIRLSDFGLSSRAKRGQRIHSFSGTATYLAPEIIRDTGDDGHTHCVDLWCFGVMLFIMLTQEPPFWAEHYPDLFHLIKTTEVPYHYYDYLSPDALSLLRGLLCKDPDQRLGCGPRGIADVQDHPFFASIDWKLLLAKKISPPFKPVINRGKKDQEESEKKSRRTVVPAEVFKGFSFVWNPSEEEEFLSASIDVLYPENAPVAAPTKGKSKKRKNRVLVNLFLWIKEVQGLPANLIGQSIYVRWKHEARKYLTVIGPDDEDHVSDRTAPVVCATDRSAVFSGSMDNSCIACDYVMMQDRKSNVFDSRTITFVLHREDNKKAKAGALGKATIDLSDFCFHKLEKTQIFTFTECGATVVVSILCSWKSFNGDVVDNYESHRPRGQSVVE